MLIAQPAFPHYVDTDGSPITSGSLYYGNVGANPRTSPVAVYWDAAGTQPAPQPIRTVAGYPVRNGSPANVYVNGAYSVALYNAAGELVFYAPDSADFDAVLSATSPFMRALLDDADAATARATLDAPSTSEALLKTGGTMTGKLVLDGDATLALHPTPKQQLDAVAAARMQYSLTAAQATTSGTAVDFTGIPAWAKRITVMFFGVSGTTAGAVKVRALVGGVEVTSGYTGTYFFYGSGSSADTVTDAFCRYDLTNGATNMHGATTLVLLGSNTWMCNGAVARHGGTAEFQQHTGSAGLAGPITGIRVLCTAGTFDGGSVALLIEG